MTSQVSNGEQPMATDSSNPVMQAPIFAGRLGFIIVGTPRSGTTLVQRLACEVPGVRVPPETQFLCSFLPGLLRRRRFPLVGVELREEIRAFTELRTSQGLGIDLEAIFVALEGRCDSPLDLFTAIVYQLTGSAVTVLGEKSPRHLLWSPSIARCLSHLKIVGVVRDPRSVAASRLKLDWNKKNHILLAESWAADQRLLAGTQDEFGNDRCLILRYEDVVSDPDTARERLARFLGVRVDEARLRQPAHIKHTDIVLPRESWKANVTGPVTAEFVESWRESLTDNQVEEILGICWRMIRHFGYSDAPGALAATRTILKLLPKEQTARFGYRLRRRRQQRRAERLTRHLWTRTLGLESRDLVQGPVTQRKANQFDN